MVPVSKSIKNKLNGMSKPLKYPNRFNQYMLKSKQEETDGKAKREETCIFS